MLQTILNWLVPFVLGGLSSCLIVLIKKLAKKEKGEEDGVCCLLRAEIIRQHEKWTERKYCPVYAREALTKAFEAYTKLGGNGAIKDLYNKTMALPTSAEEVKSEHNNHHSNHR